MGTYDPVTKDEIESLATWYIKIDTSDVSYQQLVDIINSSDEGNILFYDLRVKIIHSNKEITYINVDGNVVSPIYGDKTISNANLNIINRILRKITEWKSTIPKK